MQIFVLERPAKEKVLKERQMSHPRWLSPISVWMSNWWEFE